MESLYRAIIKLHEHGIIVPVRRTNFKRELHDISTATYHRKLRRSVGPVRCAVWHDNIVINDLHRWNQVTEYRHLRVWQHHLVRETTRTTDVESGISYLHAVFTGDDFDVPDTLYKSDEGGRKLMSFQVADICGDDTTHFRLTVTPKGMNHGKNENDKKAVLDEVLAFAPYKLD